MRKSLLVAILATAIPIWAAAQTTGVTVVGPAGVYTATTTLDAPGVIPISGQTTTPGGDFTIKGLPPGAIITRTDTSITINWGTGPQPNPPTPPTPPSPGPSPVSGPLYVLAIYDATAATTLSADQTALKASKTISTALKEMNATWAVADVTTPTVAGWVADAKAKGIPAVLVIGVGDANVGSLIGGMTIPASGSEAAVVSLVGKIRAGVR